ncbi:hypothetical protein FQZ97_798810 [compost metagenome]
MDVQAAEQVALGDYLEVAEQLLVVRFRGGFLFAPERQGVGAAGEYAEAEVLGNGAQAGAGFQQAVAGAGEVVEYRGDQFHLALQQLGGDLPAKGLLAGLEEAPWASADNVAAAQIGDEELLLDAEAEHWRGDEECRLAPLSGHGGSSLVRSLGLGRTSGAMVRARRRAVGGARLASPVAEPGFGFMASPPPASGSPPGYAGRPPRAVPGHRQAVARAPRPGGRSPGA